MRRHQDASCSKHDVLYYLKCSIYPPGFALSHFVVKKYVVNREGIPLKIEQIGNLFAATQQNTHEHRNNQETATTFMSSITIRNFAPHHQYYCKGDIIY